MTMTQTLQPGCVVGLTADQFAGRAESHFAAPWNMSTSAETARTPTGRASWLRSRFCRITCKPTFSMHPKRFRLPEEGDEQQQLKDRMVFWMVMALSELGVIFWLVWSTTPH